MLKAVWVAWPGYVKFGLIGIYLAIIVLILEREELLGNNLIEVENYDRYNSQIVCDDRSLGARTEDGTCNILENPSEGSAYRRFGRNVQLEATYGETEADTLLTPNPRDVSNSLLAREEFKPATSVNFLASAWIQFMVHDWVDHGDNIDENPIVVELPEGDVLGTGTIEVQRTRPDPSRLDSESANPSTYQNVNTHWWDGSQLYGSSLEKNNEIRAFVDGKLKLDSDGTLPTELLSGVPVTGFNNNWWVGLSMLHQVFTLEHNAIAEKIQQTYPEASDQWIYDRARLANSALMAKIHTTEWTPAILANPVLEKAMAANWWGLIGDREGRDAYQAGIRKVVEDLEKADSLSLKLLGLDPKLSDLINGASTIDHALAGVVGAAEPKNHGVAYSLTEEFVAVYRMHPLLPDNFKVFDVGSNIPSSIVALEDTRDGDAETMLEDETGERLWYSMGITHPGSLTLHNYPEFLRNLDVPFVGNIDLATIDIVRDRERGVPRYNEFRRQIGLTPINKFEDLTTDPTTLAELKRIYSNDVEQIDTMVGQLAETVRPGGFAFGETAFQVFIINASRRLMTDRFYTTDYTAEVYTQEGMDWVEENTMLDVIRRHFPSLSNSLAGTENAFKPWGLKIPAEYNSWDACDKQELLWSNGVLRTEYASGSVPALTAVDKMALVNKIIWDKDVIDQDVAPAGNTLPIHANGAMAKAKFVATAGHPFTGIFQGNECGLLRMSVSGDPADAGFEPGLTWKAFVDGQPSENVHGLYPLSGQGDNHDIFANELSHYVKIKALEALTAKAGFTKAINKSNELTAGDMAAINQDGSAVAAAKAPTQVYFVPTADVKGHFDTAAHDFRDDLTSLTEGTAVYDVYATDQAIKTSIWSWKQARYERERRDSAVKVGSIVMDSAFKTSQFGDNGVYFKQQY
jgi:Animal haem peroxidase